MVAGAFSRESLPSAAGDFAQLLDEINFRLMHISDRLDKLEGLRGDSENLGNQEISGDLSVGGSLAVTGATTLTGTLRALGNLIVSGATTLNTLSIAEVNVTSGMNLDSLTAFPGTRPLDESVQFQSGLQITGMLSAPNLEALEAFVSDAWVNQLRVIEAETDGVSVGSLTALPGTQALDETVQLQSGVQATGQASAPYVEAEEIFGATIYANLFRTRAWDDQQVNISSVRLPAANAPTWTAYKGSQVLAFDGTSTDTIHFTAQLTHKYVEGSPSEFHIHYVPEDDTAGDVRWQFTYSWANLFAAFPAQTTVTTDLATPEVTDQHTLGEIVAEIDGTGQNLSSVLLCSLSRLGGDAADTYDGKNIYLVALDFHVQVDGIGSPAQGSK